MFSQISSILHEIVVTHTTPSGKKIYKSDNPNYKIAWSEGKPKEVLSPSRHKYSKHKSQRLYKSPGTRRKAVSKMRATNFYKKAMGVPSTRQSEEDSYYGTTSPDIERKQKIKDYIMAPYKKGREFLKKEKR